MGGTPTNGKVFIIHTFAMESLSFSSPLIYEKNKIKIGTSLNICVYVNT
jgi:hypothetical protein